MLVWAFMHLALGFMLRILSREEILGLAMGDMQASWIRGSLVDILHCPSKVSLTRALRTQLSRLKLAQNLSVSAAWAPWLDSLYKFISSGSHPDLDMHFISSFVHIRLYACANALLQSSSSSACTPWWIGNQCDRLAFCSIH